MKSPEDFWEIRRRTLQLGGRGHGFGAMVMGCLGMGVLIAFLLVLQERGKQGMERELP